MKNINKLQELRDRMREAGVDAYYINTGDPHYSEYVAQAFRTRAWLTGFTGSAGTAIVTRDEALLWTDGRYFLQAADQLKDTGFTLMKAGEPGVPTTEAWLADHLASDEVLGLNGNVVPEAFVRKLKKRFKPGVEIKHLTLVEDIWQDRPSLPQDPVYLQTIEFAGESAADKIKRLREALAEQGADAALYVGLDDICWLYNFRGSDVPGTPVALSFALITEDKAYLFIDNDKVPADLRPHFDGNGITLRGYDDVIATLQEEAGNIDVLALNMNRVGHGMFIRIPETIKVKPMRDLPQMMKAVLNETELACQHRAYLKDSVAVTKFIYWLKHTIGREPLTEISVQEQLFAFRQAQENFIEDSFAPISAYGPNGAIIHYSATEESNTKLEPRSFYLIDSGGQYRDGTTDITRTVSMGPLTEDEIDDYTYTLQSHIALADAIFREGVDGYYLDALSRQPLWRNYRDFNHGTGHAVGYLLGVHEGPQRVSRHPSDVAFKPGMVVTNEPGIYRAGRYGIRLENELLCERDREVDGMKFLRFRTVTYIPFDRDAIRAEYLSEREKHWLNTYHREVYEKLVPYLDEAEAAWLKAETAPL